MKSVHSRGCPRDFHHVRLHAKMNYATEDWLERGQLPIGLRERAGASRNRNRPSENSRTYASPEKKPAENLSDVREKNIAKNGYKCCAQSKHVSGEGRTKV